MKPLLFTFLGVVLAALGYEAAAGEFEVVDLCFAGLPPRFGTLPTGAGKGKGKGKAVAMEVDPSPEDIGQFFFSVAAIHLDTHIGF